MSRTYPTTIPTISFLKSSERKPEGSLFTLLEHKRSRGNYFMAGVAVHGILLTFAIVLPLYMTGSLNVQRYLVTPLIAPPVPHEVVELTNPEPLRIKPAPIKTPVEPVVLRTEVTAPKEIKLPEVRLDPKPVPIEPAAPKFEVLAPPAPAPASVPAPVVKTDVFSDPAAAKTAAEVASRKVLSTGFGEAASTGTARASRGVVMGSAFADTGVEGGSGARKKSGQSIASGFDDVRQAEPQAKRREVEPVRLPVEIVSKPRPDYTEEARRLRVQGDVVLRVLFAASGKVQVLDVVQGLGYGLDENARRAAEQIRFKPASNDGKPVDSTANVRIAFQLAY
jgi:TonB family protein